jgi:hypothetical protein
VPVNQVNEGKADQFKTRPHLPAFPLCSTMGGG